MTSVQLLRKGLMLGLLLTLSLGPIRVGATTPPGELQNSAAAQPLLAPGDDSWSDQFTLNGLTGSSSDDWYVYALARDGAVDIYAGGTFTLASGVAVNRVVMWDGSEWAALGSGMDDGEVKAAAHKAVDKDKAVT